MIVIGAEASSVFRVAAASGRSHQGAILLFDRATGASLFAWSTQARSP